jgi:hypothetical protein
MELLEWLQSVRIEGITRVALTEPLPIMHKLLELRQS